MIHRGILKNNTCAQKKNFKNTKNLEFSAITHYIGIVIFVNAPTHTSSCVYHVTIRYTHTCTYSIVHLCLAFASLHRRHSEYALGNIISQFFKRCSAVNIVISIAMEESGEKERTGVKKTVIKFR